MIWPRVDEVLDEELRHVENSRRLRLGQDADRVPAEKSLIGLAFSGGGIRSATFNLGVLQALAKAQLLRGFDYLSTVSGGGYIGSWLMGWMHHQSLGIRAIEKRLSTQPKLPQESADPPEVHFLRDYSNYLTPRKGILGGDFWAFVASYLRNTILNQIILVLMLLSLLLVPRAVIFLLHALEDTDDTLKGTFTEGVPEYFQSQYLAVGLALLLGLVAVFFMALNMVAIDQRQRKNKGRLAVENQKASKKKGCWFTNPWAVHALIAVPLLIASALTTYGIGHFLTEWGILDHPKYRMPLLGAILYSSLWAGALVMRLFVRRFWGIKGNGGPNGWLLLLSAVVAGAIVGYLFVPLGSVLIPPLHASGETYSNARVMTFGAPAVIVIMLSAGVLHIGLMGRGMSDAHREWWGRLGGWLMIYAFCWLFLFLIALYFPAELGKFWSWESQRHAVTVAGVLAWIVSTAYGVFFGKSAETSKWMPDAPTRRKLMHYLAKSTPYVFILGLLMALSVLAARIAYWVLASTTHTLQVPTDYDFDVPVAGACAVFFLAAVILSWRVDINEFSSHYLYRNRLVRCYLGASVPRRNAQAFTGFSEADNFPLSSLRIPFGSTDPKDARPIPIVNTSLNVVRGKELALQTRKARSFAFTPLYGGFTRQKEGTKEWESFYAPTEKAGCKLPGFRDGITLGTAMAISGAAASPNMGSYSEPALAVLMTLFDVRLGWWVGNPAGKRWRRGSPYIGFYWLLRELLSSTTDESNYVYLSDGGHFENLGVYELVRRKCKLIVACDVSGDAGYAFGDLHNAIERCRTDFGVEIVVDGLPALRPAADSADTDVLRSKAHFVTGKIRYNSSAQEEDGTIIYIKPALVKGDPDDVLAYAKTNKSFPHDTTANQWFDEAHFENYRALGEVSAKAVAGVVAAEMRRIFLEFRS